MTGTPNDIERRHEPRYKIVPEHTVEVLVQRTSEESDKTIQGQLIDLSPGGVQVCLPIYPQFLEVVGVRIVVPEASVNIDATAEVCWIRPTDDNQCVVGCSFTLRISEAIVERMAEAGFIDRRRHPRHPANICGVARWELNTEEFPVRITDYSEGGFRMVSERPCTVGATVSVEIEAFEDDCSPISAKVCWQEDRDGEYFLGCALKRLSDFQRLHELCRQHEVSDPRAAGRRNELVFVAATWLFVFIGSTLLGLKAIDAWRGPQVVVSGADYQPAVFHRRSEQQPAQGRQSDERPSQPTEGHRTKKRSGDGLPKTVDVGAASPSDAALPASDSPGPAIGPAPSSPTHSDSGPARGEAQDAPEAEGPSSTIPLDPPHSTVDTAADWADQPSAADGPASERSINPQVVARPPVDPTAPLVSAPPTAPPTSTDLEKAQDALLEGDRLYRDQHFDEALRAFRGAVQYDPHNPLPHYLLAMTHYQLGQFQEADSAVRKAIRLERQQPVDNWGARLTRYQGRPRLWLEQQRSAIARADRE